MKPQRTGAYIKPPSPQKLRKVIFLSLILCVQFVQTSCLDSMTRQDHEFAAKIKEHIKMKDEMIRVSEIHPKNWERVCFTAAGAEGDAIRAVSEFKNIEANSLIVTNRERSDARHGDMFEWGIYFYYPPNKIEYFRIDNNDMYPNQLGAITDDYACVSRENAYFKATQSAKVKKSGDIYLDIQLTEINQKKR